MGGWQQETPKSRNPVFRRVHHVVVGNNRDAVEAAGNVARTSGYNTLVLDKFLTGEAAEAGRWMGEWGRDLSGRPGLSGPLCVLAGGELTVAVRGKGLGGRAQEFALSAALELHGARNVWAVGFGTDGRDGPTDVAGAIVDGGTVERAKRRGLAAAAYLRRNDSYNFFKGAGGHIVTGPTVTNVNDLYLILVHPPKRKSLV
jgi:glycerate-2-kinase